MNVKKIIHEELGQDLEKIGFNFNSKNRLYWSYEREQDKVIQEIIIARDRYEKNYLKVMLHTDAYGQDIKEFCDFVPECGAEQWEYWSYENERELREIIREFRRLLFLYGFKMLDEISIPTTDAVPTNELYEYLYRNHQKLYEEYRERYQTQHASPEEVIEKIYNRMEEKLDVPFDEVKFFLCALAALYGHTISWGNRGEWVWLKEKRCCRLIKILDTVKETDPLMFCISEWDCMRKNNKERLNKLSILYGEILYFYYQDHP